MFLFQESGCVGGVRKCGVGTSPIINICFPSIFVTGYAHAGTGLVFETLSKIPGIVTIFANCIKLKIIFLSNYICTYYVYCILMVMTIISFVLLLLLSLSSLLLSLSFVYIITLIKLLLS